MDAAMNENPEDLHALGHRLRITIRSLAGARRISIAELGRWTGIGEQKLRDRLDDEGAKPPTRLSVEEAAAIAQRFGMSLTELIQIAETGQGFPLRTKVERWDVIPGSGGEDGEQTTLPLFRPVAVS